MRCFIFCFAVLFAVIPFSAGQSAAQTIEGLHGGAAPAIKAEIRKGDFGDPVMAHVFYGDLTGTGTNDAIAFLYHPSGGNSDVLTTWIWRDTGNGYQLTRAPSIKEVFGIDPRDVKFSAGRIAVTMTVPKPDDPRCCPTGKRKFSLSIEGSSQSDSKSAATTKPKELDVPVLEQGGDGQMANCASSMVTGLKAYGDGFLAVRSGPGSEYRKIDELHNGDVVLVFEQRGEWAGVVYRTANVTCSSTKTHAVTYKNKGWVHTNWLKDIAG